MRNGVCLSETVLYGRAGQMTSRFRDPTLLWRDSERKAARAAPARRRAGLRVQSPSAAGPRRRARAAFSRDGNRASSRARLPRATRFELLRAGARFAHPLLTVLYPFTLRSSTPR